MDRSGDGTPTVLHRYFNGTLCWVSAALKLKVKEGWPSQSPPRHKTEHTVEIQFIFDSDVFRVVNLIASRGESSHHFRSAQMAVSSG